MILPVFAFLTFFFLPEVANIALSGQNSVVSGY